MALSLDVGQLIVHSVQVLNVVEQLLPDLAVKVLFGLSLSEDIEFTYAFLCIHIQLRAIDLVGEVRLDLSHLLRQLARFILQVGDLVLVVHLVVHIEELPLLLHELHVVFALVKLGHAVILLLSQFGNFLLRILEILLRIFYGQCVELTHLVLFDALD